MADEILGINGVVNIDDIKQTFDELISSLNRVGVKTDEISAQMSKALSGVANSADKDLASKTSSALEILKQAIDEANKKVITMPDSIKAARNQVNGLEKACFDLQKRLGSTVIGSSEFNRLNKQLESQQKELLSAKGSLESLTTAYGNAQRNVVALKAMYDNLAESTNTTKRSFSTLREEYKAVDSAGQNSVEVLGAMTNKMQGIAATIAGGMGVRDFVSKLINVRGEFENIETSLRVLLGGSEDKMQNLLGQLKDYALISPLTTKDMASALQMMIGFGLNAEDSVKYLKALGDISMGDTAHFNALALAFSQMSAAGKLMGQDLLQMINAGFNPLEQMSKTTGKSISELKDEMSKGAISSQMVQKAFIDATSAGGRFNNMAEEGSKNINGQLSMLAESFDNAYNDMGKAAEKPILSTISGLTSLIENYQSIAKALAPIITAYGTYKAAVMASIAIDKVKAHNAINGINQEIDKINEEIVAKQKLLGLDSADDNGKSANPEVAAAQEKLAAQKQVNAELDLEMQKRVEITQLELKEAQASYDKAAANLNLADQENLQAQINLTNALDAKKAADDKVQSARDYLDTLKETADYEGGGHNDETNKAYDNLQAAIDEQQAAAKDVETASEAANTAEKNLNTAAGKLNSAETTLNTAQTEANTAAKNLNSVSNHTSSVTTRGKTIATETDTTATTSNTLATKLNAVGTKVAAGAQALWTAAVTATKNAFNSLKIALATNPIGLAITAITTAISLFWSFNDETDKAAENTERFGEAASKTMNNVNTLYAVVNHASKNSQTYKDAMAQLTDTCEKYGIQIDKEGNLIDQVNEKRKELIALIQQEGAERVYANRVSDVNDKYNKEIENIQGEIADKLKMGGEDAKNYASIISQQAIANMDALANAYNKYQKIIHSGSSAYASAEGQAALEQYLKLKEQVTAAAKAAAKANGEDANSIKSIDKAANEYIPAMIKSRNERDKSIKTLDNAREATNGLISATSGLSGEQKRLATQAYLAHLKVDDLKSNVENLLKQYNNNKLNWEISLSLDSTKVPEWMKSQLGIGFKGGSSQTQVNTAKNRAAWWASQLKRMNDTGAKVMNINGTVRSRSYVAQRAAEYTVAASQGQESYDKAQADKANTKTTKPKTTKHTGKTAAELQAEADKKIADENRRWSEQQAKEAREREYAQQQAVIDTMQEGNAKKLAQLKLDHQKELDQIKQQEVELLKARQNHAKTLYEANLKNKGKDFYKSTEYKNVALTDEEKSGIEAKTKSVNIKYDRNVSDIYKEEEDAMRKYLKDYGTFQQQKLAIAEEYAEKIAKAQNVAEKMSLSQEQTKTERDLDNKYYKDNVDWESLFGDIGNRSLDSLKGLKGQLKTQLDRKDLSIEDYKALVEQIDKVNDAIVDAQNKESIFFAFTSEHTKEKKKLQMELNEAIEQEKKAREDVATAQLGVGAAQSDIASQMRSYGIDLGKGTSDISTSDAQEAVREVSDKFGDTSKEAETISRLFIKLSSATSKLTEATDKQREASNKARTAQNKKDDSEKKTTNQKAAEWADAYRKYDENIQELPNLTKAMGISENSEVGKRANSLASASNNALGAMADYASGNYIGAAAKGLSAVKGLGETIFGNGDSDPHLKEDMERLTASNEALRQAIDMLKDEIKDSSNIEAVSKTNTMLQYMKEAEANQQKIIERNARNYKSGTLGIGGKRSSAYKLNQGMSAEDWQRISKITDTQVNGAVDFLRLSSEKMADVAKYLPDLYAKIKDLLNDGYQDAAQYLDEYIKYADQLKDLQDSLDEKMTGLTFDNLQSNFADALSNMDNTWSDFADNIEETLNKAIINGIVSDNYKPKLQAWYKKFSDAMQKGMTLDERTALMNEYHSIVDDAVKERDKLEDMGIVTQTSTSQQSASYGESKTITQDQASEMNGRLTALQWSDGQILQYAIQRNAILSSLQLDTTNLRISLSTIRGYVSEIVDIQYDSLANIQKIANNTNPLPDMKGILQDIYKKIKNL